MGVGKARGQQRPDSTPVAAAARLMQRLELVGETVRAALTDLAVRAPAWVRGVAQADWYERYQRRIEHGRLPKGKAARASYAHTGGEDGVHLLGALAASTTPAQLRALARVKTLEGSCSQQYEPPSVSKPSGQFSGRRPGRWKDLTEVPRAAGQLGSPDELAAR